MIIELSTPEEIHAYRMKTLLIGLRAEVKGMRLTNKGQTCYARIKKEFGLKGSKQKVLDQFEMQFYKLGGKII